MESNLSKTELYVRDCCVIDIARVQYVIYDTKLYIKR